MRKLVLGIFLLWVCSSTYAQTVRDIFTYGVQRGWAGQAQLNRLETALQPYTQADLLKFAGFLNQAKTPAARFFTLESWLAGDDQQTLQAFINELNAVTEKEQLEGCMMNTAHSLIQQWENSCPVTTVQTFLGDLSPRYAWQVKRSGNYSQLDPSLKNGMAQQQKMLMEKYGGKVAPRGDYKGTYIGILNPLNEWVGLILGVRFRAEQISGSLAQVLPVIRQQLNAGINVPLLISFEGTSGASHFVLVMGYRYGANGTDYLFYDPWDGITGYVPESNLLKGSMAPLQNNWKIKVNYYYPATTLSAHEINQVYQQRNR